MTKTGNWWHHHQNWSSLYWVVLQRSLFLDPTRPCMVVIGGPVSVCECFKELVLPAQMWKRLTNAETCPEWTRLAKTWPGLTWPGLTRPDLTRLDPIWLGLIQLDPARSPLTRLGPTWPDPTTRPDLTRPDPTWPVLTRPDSTLLDLTRLDPIWPDLTWLDLTWPDFIRPDPIWPYLTLLEPTWLTARHDLTGGSIRPSDDSLQTVLGSIYIIRMMRLNICRCDVTNTSLETMSLTGDWIWLNWSEVHNTKVG